MYLTAGARHEKDPHLYFTGVLVWFAQRLLESLWTSRLWHKTREGIFFLFKKGPPTFQCNETPPIPQTLLIHIYSILMLIYTLSWCMKHLYSTLCCEATKRLHQLNESQVVLLTQHLGIRATQHSHRRAERVLDKLVGCLLTQRHDSFN